jgi:hypothetical protein
MELWLWIQLPKNQGAILSSVFLILFILPMVAHTAIMKRDLLKTIKITNDNKLAP